MIQVCFLFLTNEDNLNKSRHHIFTLFFLIIRITFLLQDNTILFRSESLKEWFVFHDLSCVLKWRQDICFFFLTYNTLRATTGLFFSNFCQSYLFIKGLIHDIFCDFFQILLQYLVWLLQHIESIYHHHW